MYTHAHTYIHTYLYFFKSYIVGLEKNNLWKHLTKNYSVISTHAQAIFLIEQIFTQPMHSNVNEMILGDTCVGMLVKTQKAIIYPNKVIIEHSCAFCALHWMPCHGSGMWSWGTRIEGGWCDDDDDKLGTRRFGQSEWRRGVAACGAWLSSHQVLAGSAGTNSRVFTIDHGRAGSERLGLSRILPSLAPAELCLERAGRYWVISGNVTTGPGWILEIYYWLDIASKNVNGTVRNIVPHLCSL